MKSGILTLCGHARTGLRRRQGDGLGRHHRQSFEPTDLGLMMFCHEGPWHKVDRIWTIRTDGTGLTKIHMRTITPDQKWIVFRSNIHGATQVYAVEVNKKP
jgi:hypothetical protein